VSGLRTLTTVTRQVEHRVRGSRFIGQAAPVAGKGDISELMKELRGQYPDATHICHAYRLAGSGGEVTEFSTDAGEPSGSAGLPLLNALRHAGLVNVLAWVVRYFGGTKLGIPGLIEAYGQAVRLSLEGARAEPWVAMRRMRVSLPYPLVDRVKAEIQKLGGRVTQESFSEQVVMDVSIPIEHDASFSRRLGEWGRGTVGIDLLGD